MGVDHAGFPLKATVVKLVEELGHTVEDFGTDGPEPVDYPDFARAVAAAVAAGHCDRGILICGSGVGTSIAANKVPGVRAGLCEDVFSARQGVEDDDMNVLCLGARVIGSGLAAELV